MTRLTKTHNIDGPLLPAEFREDMTTILESHRSHGLSPLGGHVHRIILTEVVPEIDAGWAFKSLENALLVGSIHGRGELGHFLRELGWVGSKSLDPPMSISERAPVDRSRNSEDAGAGSMRKRCIRYRSQLSTDSTLACCARGSRIEPALRTKVSVFWRKLLRYAALGTGCTLTVVLRLTQRSSLRGTVNECQPYAWVRDGKIDSNRFESNG